MTESFSTVCVKMLTEITQTLVYHVVVGLKIFTFYVTITHETPVIVNEIPVFVNLDHIRMFLLVWISVVIAFYSPLHRKNAICREKHRPSNLVLSLWITAHSLVSLPAIKIGLVLCLLAAVLPSEKLMTTQSLKKMVQHQIQKDSKYSILTLVNKENTNNHFTYAPTAAETDNIATLVSILKSRLYLGSSDTFRIYAPFSTSRQLPIFMNDIGRKMLRSMEQQLHRFDYK